MLAADIRLDNRGEIIGALGVSSDGSDADLLLTAWHRLGAASLNLIVGDFAFALFDGNQHKLTLVRDSAGQRPLYYRFGVHGAAFASLPHEAIVPSYLSASECSPPAAMATTL